MSGTTQNHGKNVMKKNMTSVLPIVFGIIGDLSCNRVQIFAQGIFDHPLGFGSCLVVIFTTY